MNIDSMTIGQIKTIQALFQPSTNTAGLNTHVGERVIIRTYKAGVWLGKLVEKSGREVILKDARRMWRWHAKESISLSGVAVYGINQDKSKIAPAISKQWLEAIEIMTLSDVAINSIEARRQLIFTGAVTDIPAPSPYTIVRHSGRYH